MDFRLFVSHRSHTPEACERLRLICHHVKARAAAEQLRVRVLVDHEQIEGGDEWRRRIAFLLHVCHGGVVLLDEDALASRWVLAEATVMSLRTAADPGFVFLPVSYLPESALRDAAQKRPPDHTGASWEVVDLLSVQYVQASAPADVAAHVVSSLQARGVAQRTHSPADRLADQLAPKLRDAGPQALQELADRLGEARSYLTADTRAGGAGAAAQAALAMVQHRVAGGDLTSTLELMDGFGTAFPSGARREIVEELAPLSVQTAAAALLTRRRPAGGYAHTSLRSEEPSFTVPLHIRRAHLARVPPRHFAIENTHGVVDELRESLRSEFRQRLAPRGRPLTDEQLEVRLRESADLYVWMPGPVQRTVLKELERAYPRISFIVHHCEGSQPPAPSPELLPLTPVLTRVEEEAIRDDYDLVMDLLEDAGR